MLIKVTYEPTAKELANASSLFIEKKPFMLFAIGFLNVFAGIILLIIVFKLVVVKMLLPSEWLALLGASLWLFVRRPFNEWLLRLRMKNSFLLGYPLTVEITLNGIAWSGKRVRTESMGWEVVKYVMEAKNGFLLPNAVTKFLWLPFRGFESDDQIDAFRTFVTERKIPHRVYSRWEC